MSWIHMLQPWRSLIWWWLLSIVSITCSIHSQTAWRCLRIHNARICWTKFGWSVLTSSLTLMKDRLYSPSGTCLSFSVPASAASLKIHSNMTLDLGMWKSDVRTCAVEPRTAGKIRKVFTNEASSPNGDDSIYIARRSLDNRHELRTLLNDLSMEHKPNKHFGLTQSYFINLATTNNTRHYDHLAMLKNNMQSLWMHQTPCTGISNDNSC